MQFRMQSRTRRRSNVAAFGERPGAKMTDFLLDFLSGKLFWLNFFLVEFNVCVNDCHIPLNFCADG